MNIPAITNIDTALKIYYSHSELSNKEMAKLFGKLSSATISRLKKHVKNEMNAREMLSYGAHTVNTVIAYEIWGINVTDLEKRKKKINELNL